MFDPGSMFGSYQIGRLLGEGAMGRVYQAVDTRLDRAVALKLIRSSLSKSPDYRARLAQEAKQAARIDSPYVVKVWEHSEIDNHPFISLELIYGDDLRSSAASMSFDQKIELARQVAEGLKAAHGEGLVHRDLKPENIKITPGGQAKILDFGLAKAMTPDTVDEKGNIEGTLYYLSPEQVGGETLGAASDVFSYGVVLYELFTGIRPFEGAYPSAIIYSILHESPSEPQEIVTSIPEWLNVLIMRALAKQPASRYVDMQAVLEAFTHGRDSGQAVEREKYVEARQTVTVIDIQNLSGDPSWDYFCIGFTEDVIGELSRRTGLIVSAQASKVYSRNIREVFERCRSHYVIVGSLRKWKDEIQLHLSIYGDDGNKLIFGEQFSGSSDELFKVLATAAREVAIALANQSGSSTVEFDDYLKTDISAYEYYLKGKSYYQTNKPDDLEFALMMFRKALEIDPTLAFAHAGLSDVYSFKYMAYYDRSPHTIDAAKSEALSAIAIAPTLPEAHRSLGRYYMFSGDPISAEQSFLKAIEYNPKYAIGHRTIAWLAEMQGNHDLALSWARKALELAPCDLETLLLLSILHMDSKKYTLAMATLQRAIELGPDYGRAYHMLGTVYLKLGVLEQALENFLLAAKFKGDPNCWINAGYVHLVHMEYDAARDKFAKSAIEGFFPFVANYYLGFVEQRCGRKELAAQYFHLSIEQGRAADSPEFPNFHVRAYRALALASLGRNEEAIELVNDLVGRSALDGEVLYEIARAYAILRDSEKSNEYIARAIAGHAGPTEREISFDPHFADQVPREGEPYGRNKSA